MEIKCDQEKIVVSAMDPSHVSMVHLYLPSSFFSEYEVNEPISLNVDCESFVNILEAHRPDDSISFYFDKKKREKENKNILHIEMSKQEKKGKRFFRLSLLDEVEKKDYNADGLLNITFQNETDIDFPILENVVKTAAMFGESIEIHVTKSEENPNDKDLFFRYVGIMGEGEDIIDPDDLRNLGFKMEGKWIYTNKYIRDILKIKNLVYRTTLSFGQEGSDQSPLKIYFDLGHGGSLEFFLAPRVEEDDNDYYVVEDEEEID